MSKPAMLILSGPSGAGKTTLCHALIDAVDDAAFAVSHTTRPPRPGEIDGQDYHFVDDATFDRLIRDGEMLEYAQVYNYRYGTSRSSVEQGLAAGKILVFDIDWQGNRRLRQLYPDAVSVFILPPAGDVAEQRLRSRQQDSEQVIQQRMAEYASQQAHRDEFDHVIVNRDLDVSLDRLIDILRH